ncbi:hypothetical protein THTE_0254 [Thermogutta terrifontis]|uniref:Uncharacterized protein n=1 Tax=Thermogutta terrifontis TaxID=1331910 RepID=A0A286RA68_9BACT|nr:hypothetical protein THTE_0254 [Thermogutta terrifontis]
MKQFRTERAVKIGTELAPGGCGVDQPVDMAKHRATDPHEGGISNPEGPLGRRTCEYFEHQGYT